MDHIPSFAVLRESPYLVVFAGCIMLLLARSVLSRRRRRGSLPLPPGPRRLPLIGNMLDMPAPGVPEFQHWLRHNALYGPVSSLEIMGQTIVLLHSRDAVRQLLEKRSKSTSSRPHMEFGHGMCGYDNILSVQKFEDSSYVPRRRLVHQYLGTPAASERYQGMQEAQAGRMLRWMLDAPERLMDHIQYFSAAVVLEATYGYTLGSSATEDPLVTLMQEVLDNITDAFVPMAWSVDALPALRHVPAWLPLGADFVRTARRWKLAAETVADTPLAFVRAQMRRGAHRPSYVANILERELGGDPTGTRKHSTTEDDVKWTAATMYGAGVETSSSTLEAFVLAMLLFPDVQIKAQQEIDRVLGAGSRLPTCADRANLPYTSQVVTEALRWFPVLPMGVAHVTQEPLEHDGYAIPKGAYLLPATWWLCHDPAAYADPHVFDPDRYLAPRGEPDPRGVVFGFGRRICPGRYFADASLWVAIARVLAAFTISSAVDEEGRERRAELGYTSSLTSRPTKFPVSVAPRSEKHAELIRGLETGA
ncbi:cytochrome P450 oxidoreductase OrdA-like protein [Cordyceps fumosorosea ARSEF 2679]|uniref:Cytochrome P450 oxidoreductase OrdA-like protein n=1 Tax=Cordyceps fumosorosea (strain ARSEF 2679) TaxID=1081104 RepID=A0A168B0Q2_CORFA|nr:cytochrome P450 oxidoreductase OrdA-like protein [Cordyceps fumosorosea ARSEF 2679]OAA69455.1 cytochrome P450 oxidoreductase OrdA-like protein [Cordyceps fumosorosea ARSEF 2679]